MAVTNSRRILTSLALAGWMAVTLSADRAWASSEREGFLRTPMAREASGRYHQDDYSLCQVRPRTGWGTTEPRRFKAHFYSEASTELMSRDRFVAITEKFKWIVLGRITERLTGTQGVDAIGAVKCKPLDGPIESFDYQVKVFFGESNIRFELWDVEKPERLRLKETWENVLGF